MMVAIDWILENWMVIVVVTPIVLAFAYAIAKRTKTTKDDAIVEQAIGIWAEIIKFVKDMQGAFAKKPTENKK
tara:strand:+ start:632 stop:850 length:219 start_codon:yes stop_codon:yes gene_type:complete